MQGLAAFRYIIINGYIEKNLKMARQLANIFREVGVKHQFLPIFSFGL